MKRTEADRMSMVEAAAYKYVKARMELAAAIARLAEANVRHLYAGGPEPIELRIEWHRLRSKVDDAYNFLKTSVAQGDFAAKYEALEKIGQQEPDEPDERAHFHCGYNGGEECDGGPEGYPCVGALCGYESRDQAVRQRERAEETNRRRR